jgi:DNA-binding transcriptional MerR regulator/methylmalonyl-CoA mutase cobalamin-binding subunit
MHPRGLYRIQTIARMTGFTPAVLRVWETRHGLLRPQRSAGGQRLYTDDDLRLLRRVRTLIDQGRTIGEVALVGRGELLREGPSARPAPPSDGGPLDALVAAVARAAVDLDAVALEQLLDEAFATLSAPAAIHHVVEPAAHEVGERWASGECSVAGEHLVSLAFRRRVHALVESSRPSSSAPEVICACLPDELHELGMLIVAYYLGRLGCRVTYLGAAVPLPSLEAAVDRLVPTAVFLSVTDEALLRRHYTALAELARRHAPATHFVLGGPRVGADAPPATALQLWPATRPLSELGECLLQSWEEVG